MYELAAFECVLTDTVKSKDSSRIHHNGYVHMNNIALNISSYCLIAFLLDLFFRCVV